MSKGIKSLKSNLSKFFKDVKGTKTEKAVYQIAKEGLALASTYTPVDTSNLVNSQDARITESNDTKVVAVASFNAEYALFVHEKDGVLKGKLRWNGNGYYWSPDAEPQFLVKGFDELKPVVPKILEAIYRVE